MLITMLQAARIAVTLNDSKGLKAVSSRRLEKGLMHHSDRGKVSTAVINIRAS
jgi:hypothetical protein